MSPVPTHEGAVRTPRLVGVLGGMGPAATADFYLKLIESCPATDDQQHVPVIIWGDPSTPDRSQALLGLGENPTPWLRRGVEHLRDAGAEVIVVPCNTAHAFIERAMDGLGLPLIHMIDEAAASLAASLPTPTRVGLLATDGTIHAGLYQNALRLRGVHVVVPTRAGQLHAMEGIRSVKAGNLEAGRAALEHAAVDLMAQGVEAIIAGCTEVPLGLAGSNIGVRVYDPTQILVDRLVAEHLTGVVNE